MGNQHKQLTLKERYQIEAFCKLDFSARKMAKELGRSNKTISNEFNGFCVNLYCAETAHQQMQIRRSQAAKYTKCSTSIKEHVRSLLVFGLSPEQIAGRMKIEKTANPLSCNTIYNLIKRERWHNLLARKGKPYKKRIGVEAGVKLIPERVDISERPSCVDDKVEMGHWEGDTVYGQDGYLVTLVERVSKLLVTCRVPNKTKKEVTRAINKLLKPFQGMCKTITFDNGGEFAGHKKVSKALGCDIYFAKPYHSWERGLNENTNGLLRRFFPKGMAIGSLSHKEIKKAEFLINMRPRKALDYLSPYEYLTDKRVSFIAEI